MRGAHRPNNIVKHDMDTMNQGVILPAERSSRVGPIPMGGREARNAFEEPKDIVFGSNGCIGGGDPMNHEDYDGDFDGDMYEGGY